VSPTGYALRAYEGVGPPNAVEVDTVTGNVGINNATPNAALHIGGTPGTDGLMFPDDTLQTTALPSPCLPGQVVKWDDVNAQWKCDFDIDTDTDTFAGLSCPTDNQILKWNAVGGNWVCGPDRDTQNTLDEAYDEGGPGAGRNITADSGAVAITVPPGAGSNGIEVVAENAVGRAAYFEHQNATNGAEPVLVMTNSTIAGANAITAMAVGNGVTRAIQGTNGSAVAGAVGVEGTVTTGGAVANAGVRGTTGATGAFATGVEGEALGATGQTIGVHGTTNSTTADAAGVRGDVVLAAGAGFGVHGVTASNADDTVGVRGEALAATGKTFGAYGSTASAGDDSAGVKGVATADGIGYGVYGFTSSSKGNAAGVKGEVAGPGSLQGARAVPAVHGVSNLNLGGVFKNGVAIQAEMNAGTGGVPQLDAMIGVRGYSPGITDPTTRVGLEGDASASVTQPLASSGVRGWIKASNSSPDNGASGVVGEVVNDTSPGPRAGVPPGHNGVWGITQSSKATSAGVLGETTAPDAVVYGVHGRSDSVSSSAAGVRGTGNNCSGAGAVNIHDGALTVTGPAKTADTVDLPAPTTPIQSCQAAGTKTCTSTIYFPRPECVDPLTGDITLCPETSMPLLEGACNDGVTITHDCTMDPTQVYVDTQCVTVPHCHIIGWQWEVVIENCLVRADSIILLTIYEPGFDDPITYSYTAHVINKVSPPPPGDVGPPAYFTVRYAAIGNGPACIGTCPQPTRAIKLDYLIINPVQ